jgi:hypothetical protein
MVEAVDHLWLLHTSILEMYAELFYLSMSYVGIWVHPYTVTPLKLGQILAILGDVKWKWCHDVMV